MRMRIQIDAVIEIADREGLPIVRPNDFVDRGLRSILKGEETAYIEPGVLCKTTLLGAMGKRMITRKELRR